MRFQTSDECLAMGYGIRLYDPAPGHDPLWLIGKNPNEEVRTYEPVVEYRAVIEAPPEITIARIDQIKAAAFYERLRKGQRTATTTST